MTRDGRIPRNVIGIYVKGLAKVRVFFGRLSFGSGSVPGLKAAEQSG